jgi:hypothetical protein
VSEEAGLWHGWAAEDSALFISPLPDEDHVGLYTQQGRVTELAAVFTDPAMAQLVMDWLDNSLTATGEANNELVTRLQTEQPLLFAQPSPPQEDEDDDDGE